MCGIIAVVRSQSTRSVPDAAAVCGPLDEASRLLDGLVRRSGPELGAAVDAAAAAVQRTDELLRGAPGVRALIEQVGLAARVGSLITGIDLQVTELEAALDADTSIRGVELERVNAALILLKDAVWSVRRDRLRAAEGVAALVGPGAGPAAIAVGLSMHQALSALDRLEVRGRDSAGLHLLVTGHGIDLDSPALRADLQARRSDELFGSMALRTPEGHLSLVYKAAAEIGELGDNTRVLREAIAADPVLRQALASPEVAAVVLGHTRWASVGIISQPNAHPLNSDELDEADISQRPYVTAVLNGDVDNFADLKLREALRIADEITTDAKVIPTLTARAMLDGATTAGAFRDTVNLLEGSVAIAASAAADPADLMLALRGSGQAIYIGLAEDAYIVASEPYGVVEETARYVRLDGEVPADPTNPASRGQVVRLHGDRAGLVEGIERWAYDGTPVEVAAEDVDLAQITTRDIDRGDSPHFLLKEMGEAAGSFRKTLRGKLLDGAAGPEVLLGDEVLSPAMRAGLADGSIRRIIAIGQGTAAVASRSLVEGLAAFAPQSPLRVESALATELSGFDLAESMTDTLVVAVSQSGTTTDTNRTVDLVRARGAHVVAIVNRRNSDLTDRADGVLYTSDGRDVEMSVASTKAFYAQIAACFLLAAAIADAVGASSPERVEVLEALRAMPAALEATFALRPEVARAAQDVAPSRRYWAIVGNGANRIAAEEVRIKLSELCYKAIACDGTEDKKHIDLSSEPMILVCAAGLRGSTADDVAKEVAIYRAHRAAPVVVASHGEERFSAAHHVISVPVVHHRLAFVLSAMVGHLFGYEAALAIDAQARPLREARASIDEAIANGGTEDGEQLMRGLQAVLATSATRYFDTLRSGALDGNLEASTASRLASLWRYALGIAPLESYQIEHGKVGTPGVVIEDLSVALSSAIDELTRPIDAIKHQAKTVTVGISRSDETLMQVPLVKEVLATGAPRDRLSYSTLRTLAALEPLVAEVLGHTRYAIEGHVDPAGHDEATVVIVDRGGLGRELRSRTVEHPELRGTKRWVAVERTVLVARGRSDGRTVIIVPEIKDGEPTGLALLHVTLREQLPLSVLRSVLQGYRNRYGAIKHAVTETEPVFRDDLLVDVPIVDLMTEPVNDLAERWRS
ncbi:MAG: SIS domain-containing protein [Acidobacteria bacterium]|nr:SIS domain-containing protein [Acidobacteriota bacterium]